MADTINDLYLKYVNSVGSTLEDDRYFRYLFEIVQAGANTLRQNHQVLHKVVDERYDGCAYFVERADEKALTEAARKVEAVGGSVKLVLKRLPEEN
mgnify:CR=1 FL=1